MHSAKGHIVVDERWRLQLDVAALCRSVALRSEGSLAGMFAPLSANPSVTVPAAQLASSAADATAYRAISYYSYRYL